MLYVIFMAIAGIISLGAFLTLASQGGGLLLVALIAAPIAFFFYLLIYRVLLEFIVVIFRIAENTSVIAKGSQPPNAP